MTESSLGKAFDGSCGRAQSTSLVRAPRQSDVSAGSRRLARDSTPRDAPQLHKRGRTAILAWTGRFVPVAGRPLLPTLENGSASWNAVILGKKMPTAIDAIVDAYVKLGDSRSLEGLKAQRLRLAAASRDRTDFDFSLLLGQIDNEIIAIDAGLESLREVPSHPPAE